MASKVNLHDCFDSSGPKHLVSKGGAGSSINWDNEEHRRCIAACLVKATYVMEKDRPRCRVYNKGLAPPWWESFQFDLREVLKCDSNKNDQFIFGAVFEYLPPAGMRRQPSAPHYVFAFRGTMPLHPKALHDLFNDIKILLNDVPCCKRSQSARNAVKNMLLAKGADSCVVWLAGHSLGASLALDVGRTMMADHGINLKTFLFNPPHVSPLPALDMLHAAEVAKTDLFTGSYMIKAALGATVMRCHKRRMEELFDRLSPWAPELYVHERDPICKGFIDYFEQRQKVEERFRGIAKAAMKLSYRDMLLSFLGSKKERPHLLPSARLWKNTSTSSGLFGSHDLKQWWKSDSELMLSSRRYTYPGA
ncbi:GDSL esterase/lipase At4g10955-like [Phragmites australis]|uniref:GDSL esterase/lipase At4g10955-like n=1 Tax=Phragmites australis TaxID=29695 RepID=UPI002D78C6F1|nr:GDSL esterase/lipase At4g10955-like [Phragmites australis]